jgi:RimJ/RimL family protein N-acetyltransferase
MDPLGRSGSGFPSVWRGKGLTPEAVPYRIETERLILRCWDLPDAAALAEATAGEREWFAFAPWVARIQSVEEALAYARASRGRFDLMRDFAFAAFLKSPARLVGGVQIHCADAQSARVSVDYWLRRDASGQGYAREAVAAVVDMIVRDLSAHRIEILVAVNHAKSRALATALGFHKEGVLRRTLIVDDRHLDMVVYGMLASEHIVGSYAHGRASHQRFKIDAGEESPARRERAG